MTKYFKRPIALYDDFSAVLSLHTRCAGRG